MKLSRTVAYAVQATLHLAQCKGEGPIPCSQLALMGDLPERFLLQILRNLVAHGVLHSTRGADGGYSVERSPEEISLLEIIEAVDGPLKWELPMGNGCPPSWQTKLKTAIASVSAQAREELAAIRLAHFIPSPPNRKS